MEPSNPNSHPDDGRLMLAVCGLLFIPLSVAAVYGLNFNMPAPQGPWNGESESSWMNWPSQPSSSLA